AGAGGAAGGRRGGGSPSRGRAAPRGGGRGGGAGGGRAENGGVTVAALGTTPVVRQPIRIAGADVPRDRKVAWLREADDAARAFDAAVRQVLVAYLESLQHVLIANSDGRWSEEERPRIRLVAQVVAARDDVLQTGFDGPGGLAGLEVIDAHPPALVAGPAAQTAGPMPGSRAPAAGP